MVALLNTCTTIEQQGVVQFLWAKDMAARDIHKEMLPMYGEHACHVKQSIIGCRSSRKGGQEDEHRGGRPVEIAMPATLQCVEDII
jgi:hypothetical protein